MKKLFLLCFLLLISWVLLAQDSGYILKNPKLEFTPVLGVNFDSYYEMGELTGQQRTNKIQYPDSYRWGGIIEFNERKFWGTLRGEFLTDMDHYETYSGIWDFSLDYQLLNNEPLFVQARVSSDIPYTSNWVDPNFSKEFLTVGLHYNNLPFRRTYDKIINLYAGADYIITGEQYPTDPPYVFANFDKTIHNVFGVVINVGDIVFFEQNAHIYTEPTGWISMNPYFSSYETKAWVQVKNFKLLYYHICHHTFQNGKTDFPLISGGSDYVQIQYLISLNAK